MEDKKKKKVVPQHSSSNQIYSMTLDVFTWFTPFLLPRFIPKAAVILLNNEIDRPHLFSYLGNKSRGACTTLWATAIILGDATIEFGWMGLSVSEDRQIQADWYLETFFCRGGTGVSQPCIQMLLLFSARVVVALSWRAHEWQRLIEECGEYSSKKKQPNGPQTMNHS